MTAIGATGEPAFKGVGKPMMRKSTDHARMAGEVNPIGLILCGSGGLAEGPDSSPRASFFTDVRGPGIPHPEIPPATPRRDINPGERFGRTPSPGLVPRQGECRGICRRGFPRTPGSREAGNPGKQCSIRWLILRGWPGRKWPSSNNKALGVWLPCRSNTCSAFRQHL
jgi:hypothetical protein